MRPYFLSISLLCLWVALLSAHRPKEDVRTFKIGLFWKEEPSSVILAPGRGGYDVFADGTLLQVFDQNSVLLVDATEGQLLVKNLGETIGRYSKLEFKRKTWGSHLRIKAKSPNQPERSIPDNILIKAMGNKLRLINSVFIEHYVGGVVEAESGSKSTLEYYKVQSVICRTYALSNLRRHAREGFFLCDQVHCQVFRGRPRSNPDIQKAVIATKGNVLVDSDINLITAAFSSNCGGQTTNSEDVWSRPLSYLRSKPDLHCREMPHAHWEREISKKSWLSYLNRKFNYPIQDSAFVCSAFDYCPPIRQRHFPPDSGILLKTIRNDWKFSSAYFSIDEIEDRVIFQGRGYGHGVGVCQEGAMRKAELGMSYQDILFFYYSGVHLVDLSMLEFFRED